MVAARLAPAYNNLLDYLVTISDPHRLLAFELTPEQLQRAEELTDKNKMGRLSPDEAAELDQMMEVEMLIAGLRARALANLKKQS